MGVILAVVIGYLIGSVSFSYLFVQRIKKVDVRSVGSGNAGATNTRRVLGTKWAVVVLLLDVLKGMVAVWLGFFFQWAASGLLPGFLSLSQVDGLAPALGGLAAVLGHNWPVYFGFRGGKGVATAIGVISVLVFFPAIYVGIIAIAAIAVTGYVSLGSLLFAVLTPVAVFYTQSTNGHPDTYLYLTVFLGLLSIWKHRTNIVRLLRGNESSLYKKSSEG